MVTHCVNSGNVDVIFQIAKFEAAIDTKRFRVCVSGKVQVLAAVAVQKHSLLLSQSASVPVGSRKRNPRLGHRLQ